MIALSSVSTRTSLTCIGAYCILANFVPSATITSLFAFINVYMENMSVGGIKQFSYCLAVLCSRVLGKEISSHPLLPFPSLPFSSPPLPFTPPYLPSPSLPSPSFHSPLLPFPSLSFPSLPFPSLSFLPFTVLPFTVLPSSLQCPFLSLSRGQPRTQATLCYSVSLSELRPVTLACLRIKVPFIR